MDDLRTAKDLVLYVLQTSRPETVITCFIIMCSKNWEIEKGLT